MMRTAMRMGMLMMMSAVVGLTTGRADAAFATYTETVTGSGTLGGVSFTNALITITGTGDTTDIFSPPAFPGVFALSLASNTVTVAGLESASLTLNNVQVAVNQITATGGFAYGANGTAIVGNYNAAFASINLAASTGPLMGIASFNAESLLSTTRGNLVINTVSSSATFQATVTPNSVPEPSSLALAGVAAVAGLGRWARQRARRVV